MALIIIMKKKMKNSLQFKSNSKKIKIILFNKVLNKTVIILIKNKLQIYQNITEINYQ